MDLARWWNMKDQLERLGAAAQRRGFPRTHRFAQARSVFAVADHRCAEVFDPPGCVTLWRLVPQNKAWQKELNATWDALCGEKYDWAYLAMHLWPERVVPKCAKDRSLAIAHGLEEVFWVEGTDGKWTARKAPTRSIDELVRERTSPAVKAALKSLLEAPIAVGAVKKTRKVKSNA
jgi:hypothetical protein